MERVTRSKTLATAALAAAVCTTGANAQVEIPDLPTLVTDMNTTAYLGRWYQISDILQPYELLCNVCTHATYSVRPDGLVRVQNQANILDVQGLPCPIEGYAIQDADKTGKLTVVFFDQNPGFANYQVIRLGPIVQDKYSWALVADPLKTSLYILNRFPLMDAQLYADQLRWLEANDFDTSRLTITPQAGCSYAPLE